MAYNVWASEEYKQIRNACNRLHSIICDSKAEYSVVVSATKTLVEVVAYRREMRGIPRLASHKLNDLPIKRAKAKLLTEQPTEVSQ